MKTDESQALLDADRCKQQLLRRDQEIGRKRSSTVECKESRYVKLPRDNADPLLHRWRKRRARLVEKFQSTRRVNPETVPSDCRSFRTMRNASSDVRFEILEEAERDRVNTTKR